MATPHYYHSLKPFAALFATGQPILTYHKLGPRPPGVRLKGLYVSEKLFAQQLAELRAAGYTAPTLGKLIQPPLNGAKRIGLTFDDGFTNVLRYGLAPLAAQKFQATQFLVADMLGKTNEWDQRGGEVAEPLMDVGQVREWLAAGHEIGSHTLTHPHLTRLPLAAAREEIFASKKKLEDLFAVPIEHFCYPYGDWNDAIAELVAEAGYRTACTTLAGVNVASTSPLALQRFTARYRSINLKTIASWFRLRS